jgi:hypothetical protein
VLFIDVFECIKTLVLRLLRAYFNNSDNKDYHGVVPTL